MHIMRKVNLEVNLYGPRALEVNLLLDNKIPKTILNIAIIKKKNLKTSIGRK